MVLPRLQREAPNVAVQVERVDAQFMSRLERGTADMAIDLGELSRAMKPPVELGADRTSLVWHARMQDDPGHRWLREPIAEMAREPNG